MGNTEGLKRRGGGRRMKGRDEWMRFIRWERQSLVGLVWKVFTMKKAQRGLEKNERERIEVCRSKKGEVE